jgi:hypothetical protein
MDFLLPTHKLVLEIKRVRDARHAKTVSQELIVDTEHYRQHPSCERLWCVVYDPRRLIQNPEGLASDLEGQRSHNNKTLAVRVFVV